MREVTRCYKIRLLNLVSYWPPSIPYALQKVTTIVALPNPQIITEYSLVWKEDRGKSTHFVQFLLFILFNMRTNESLLALWNQFNFQKDLSLFWNVFLQKKKKKSKKNSFRNFFFPGYANSAEIATSFQVTSSPIHFPRPNISYNIFVIFYLLTWSSFYKMGLVSAVCTNHLFGNR